MLTFQEWLNKNINEGHRYLGPKTASALDATTSKIDSDVGAIETQIKQLQNQLSQLVAKKQRIVTGMGGSQVYDGNAGYDEPKFPLLKPNDYMNYIDTKIGRDMNAPEGQPRPVDYGATINQDRRKKALALSQMDKQTLSPSGYNLYRQLSIADPGEYPIPKNVSPEEAKWIVKKLIGGNTDYEDFDIFHYNAQNNTIHVGDPSDI